MRWMEFTIKTTSEAAEAVAERLAQLGAAGIATEDPNELEGILKSDDDTLFIEPEFLDDLPEFTRIRAYFAMFDNGIAMNDVETGAYSNIDTEALYVKGRFPSGRVKIKDFVARLQKEMDFIAEHLPSYPGELKVEEVDELSWRDKWKEFYHTIHLSRRLFVCPSWEEFKGPAGAKVIYLDPGSAFGTGTHETTQLCAKQMDEFMKPESSVLDLGTGSGILAIGAAKLGARRVKAMDISAHAVQVAQENMVKNKVDHIVTCETGELKDDKAKYDFITANLIAEVLIDLAPEFHKHMNHLGLLCCSGIVKRKRHDVQDAFEKEGYTLFQKEYFNDWYVMIFTH